MRAGDLVERGYSYCVIFIFVETPFEGRIASCVFRSVHSYTDIIRHGTLVLLNLVDCATMYMSLKSLLTAAK